MNRWIALPLAWALAAGTALAQGYPNRPLRMVIPYAPGGPVDIVGRVVGAKLGDALGQQIIIDNRAGAGGNIALEIVAKSAPDGYTLLMGANGPIAINPSLYRNMPVDTLKELHALTMVASSAMILVAHPSLPASTVKELIALAKARPGGINYASSGSGSTAHLASELFKSMAGVQMVHVPYKGAGPALADLVGGQVQTMFTGISSTLPYVKSGKLKALAVSSEKRLPIMPELAAVAEDLPGYEVATWYGVFTPVGVARGVLERLHGALVQVLGTADAQQRLAALGADAHTNTPAQFAAAIRAERAKWARIIKESGAKAD
ncbi:MAG TPA: tripartite tricarboxylate transporter substrate binding protein [Burkholderiales bacterium]|nr:tripartite tricarboxylate transporter substrate binding protein [Burkholderiales bacterium]